MINVQQTDKLFLRFLISYIRFMGFVVERQKQILNTKQDPVFVCGGRQPNNHNQHECAF